MKNECKLVKKAFSKVYHWIDSGIEFPENSINEWKELLNRTVMSGSFNEGELTSITFDRMFNFIKIEFPEMYQMYEDLEDDDLFIELNYFVNEESANLVNDYLEDLDNVYGIIKVAKVDGSVEF